MPDSRRPAFSQGCVGVWETAAHLAAGADSNDRPADTLPEPRLTAQVTRLADAILQIELPSVSWPLGWLTPTVVGSVQCT